MSPAEAQVLLSMAAAFDNRKPDSDAAKAWAVALDGLGFEDCRVALIEHFKTSTEYLMPVMIRNAVLRVRRERRLQHRRDHGALLPPAGLTDAEEIAWEREAMERIGNGEHVDCTPAYELVPGNVRELLGIDETRGLTTVDGTPEDAAPTHPTTRTARRTEGTTDE